MSSAALRSSSKWEGKKFPFSPLMPFVSMWKMWLPVHIWPGSGLCCVSEPQGQLYKLALELWPNNRWTGRLSFFAWLQQRLGGTSYAAVWPFIFISWCVSILFASILFRLSADRNYFCPYFYYYFCFSFLILASKWIGAGRIIIMWCYCCLEAGQALKVVDSTKQWYPWSLMWHQILSPVNASCVD